MGGRGQGDGCEKEPRVTGEFKGSGVALLMSKDRQLQSLAHTNLHARAFR